MNAKKPRVLIVDDCHQTLFRGLHHALQGCEVEIATDAADAADVIYRIDCVPGFDLIFCDLARGDFPGPELWAYLSLTRKDAADRVVFVASAPLRPETQEFLRSVPNPCIDLRVGADGPNVFSIRDGRAFVEPLTSAQSA